MVDEGRVTRLLRNIADRSDRLRAAAASPSVERSDLWLDGVKYLFITTIEACVDIAHHIASSERFRPPDSNADALRLLGERGVIDPALASALSRAAGFRNVLVHQYAQVDDSIVMASLDRLDTFDEFVRAVSTWLTSRDAGSTDPFD